MSGAKVSFADNEPLIKLHDHREDNNKCNKKKKMYLWFLFNNIICHVLWFRILLWVYYGRKFTEE